LRVFGCVCYALVKLRFNSKLDDHTVRCVFVGYSGSRTGYQCYDIEEDRVIRSRTVKFDESTMNGLIIGKDSKRAYGWNGNEIPMHVGFCLDRVYELATHDILNETKPKSEMSSHSRIECKPQAFSEWKLGNSAVSHDHSNPVACSCKGKVITAGQGKATNESAQKKKSPSRKFH